MKNDFRKLYEKLDDKNKMISTFKTSLEGKITDGNKDLIDTEFFNAKSINKFNYNDNNSDKDENESNTSLEENMENTNSLNLKKNIESRFLNTYCLTDNDGKIKNFNTKGITFQKTNNENHFNLKIDKISIKKVEDFLISKEKIDIGSELVLKEIFEIDNKIAKMKSFMLNMKKNEMNRILKEFNINDYERRFKTTKYEVISALIGEENTIIELNRQNREQKV